MKKIALWFFLLTKRHLKNIILVLFLIGLPISAFVISRIPAMSESKIPRIGIVLLDNDTIAKSTADLLIDSSSSLEFYLCDSTDILYASIEDGTTDCGYIFSKNLTEQLDSKSYEGCITLFKTSSDFISSLSNEVVFASLFRVYSKRLATNYIRGSSLFSSVQTDAIRMTEEKYEYYLHGAATFHIDFETLSNDGDSSALEEIEIETSVFPIRGILAILIFVAGLFGCVQWLKDCETGVFAPMSYSFHTVSRILYTLIPTFLFAISSLLTIYLAGVQVSFFMELKSMFLYILLITVFGWILTYLIKNSILLVSLMPVFIIGSLVLCPIFINMETIFPMAKILNKLFLPYYYLIWIA